MPPKFLDIPVSKVRAKIRKTPVDERPAGCDCQFIPINDKVGAKLYRNRMARDFAHKLQKLAYSKGEGPAVGAKFRYYLKHGLVTERLEVCNKLTSDEMAEASSRFCIKTGIAFYDHHAKNFGYRASERAKIMVLDFGGFHYDSSVVSKIAK